MEEKNLMEIEHLLTQSLKGVHYLFENKSIAQILSRPTEDMDFFSFDNMDRIQKLFNELISKPSFREKIHFIKNLDQESYEVLLRAYFHILDSTVRATCRTTH